MKYKVGDRVEIWDGLVVGKRYGDNVFVEEMLPWCGQVATISRCDEFYRFKGDGDGWDWTDEMIKGLVASETSDDAVNHPSHYMQGKIECIDYIIDKKLPFCLGNAIKYITRCELKNGGKNRIEDLRKAVFYINKQIEVWEAEDSE